jgi:hypothetical protein
MTYLMTTLSPCVNHRSRQGNSQASVQPQRDPAAAATDGRRIVQPASDPVSYIISPPPYAVVAADVDAAPKPPPYSTICPSAPVEPPAYANVAYTSDVAPPPFELSAPPQPPPTDFTVDSLPQPVAVVESRQSASRAEHVQRVVAQPET